MQWLGALTTEAVPETLLKKPVFFQIAGGGQNSLLFSVAVRIDARVCIVKQTKRLSPDLYDISRQRNQ